jgi:uncharacterized iron-regulated protein
MPASTKQTPKRALRTAKTHVTNTLSSLLDVAKHCVALESEFNSALKPNQRATQSVMKRYAKQKRQFAKLRKKIHESNTKGNPLSADTIKQLLTGISVVDEVFQELQTALGNERSSAKTMVDTANVLAKRAKDARDNAKTTDQAIDEAQRQLGGPSKSTRMPLASNAGVVAHHPHSRTCAFHACDTAERTWETLLPSLGKVISTSRRRKNKKTKKTK